MFFEQQQQMAIVICMLRLRYNENNCIFYNIKDTYLGEGLVGLKKHSENIQGTNREGS